MISLGLRKSRSVPSVLILALVLVFAAGVFFIVASYIWCGELVRFNPVVPDVIRDLGIAFIVSCVVAALFELYLSLHHQIETMRDVIDVIMGEQITPEVWLELKDLIALKQLIRRRAQIRLQLQRNDKLHSHEAVLAVEYNYELHGLTGKRSKVTVQHELDYQFSSTEMRLPKFERVSYDSASSKGKVFENSSLAKVCTNGRLLEFDIDLMPRGGEPVVIRTERQEIVHIPGSYNLYTPEFMKGLYIHIVGCPPEIDVEVLVRPQGRGQTLKKMGDSWSCEHLLLPGQGVEIKFISKQPNVPLPSNLSGERAESLTADVPANSVAAPSDHAAVKDLSRLVSSPAA